MKHIHPDIKGKVFDYLNIDTGFTAFAREECGHKSPERLLEKLEETIAYQHDSAIPSICSGHPRRIWQLSTDQLTAYYQILPERVEIGDLKSRQTGAIYEPRHDLLASFTE